VVLAEPVVRLVVEDSVEERLEVVPGRVETADRPPGFQEEVLEEVIAFLFRPYPPDAAARLPAGEDVAADDGDVDLFATRTTLRKPEARDHPCSPTPGTIETSAVVIAFSDASFSARTSDGSCHEWLPAWSLS
jgi:hypothetical protein